MRLLLDTHIYIWAVFADKRLRKNAMAAIRAADEVYVSAASVWEAAIKISAGKLAIDLELLSAHVSVSGFKALPVQVKHAVELAKLPMCHRDPFDRLLVAQARSESLRLMTVDHALSQYGEVIFRV